VIYLISTRICTCLLERKYYLGHGNYEMCYIYFHLFQYGKAVGTYMYIIQESLLITNIVTYIFLKYLRKIVYIRDYV
jgi:hypothetical protein